MDLVRAVLLKSERRFWDQRNEPVEIKGYTSGQVAYHVRIMHDAGLIEALDFSAFKAFDWRPTCPTWEGHDFLDAARENARWDKAKHLVKDKAGTVSFDVFKQLLISLSLKAVGL